MALLLTTGAALADSHAKAASAPAALAPLEEADSQLRFVYKEFPILGPASDFAARNRQLARALNITGTPGFVIGSEVLGGAADRRTFEALIERARQAP
jgi:protein-disulfide isomerase